MGIAQLLLLSLSFLLLFCAEVESKTYWGDVKVLKGLKQALDLKSVTPGSCVSTWDFSVDPCDSLYGEKFTCGFRCDLVVSGTSHVTDIELDHAGYSSGSIASIPWKLSPFIQSLDLSGNYLSGPIPKTLSSLTRLRRLSLSGNSFSGQIPSSIGSLSNLEELYLGSNKLHGTVPYSFNGLKNLKRLELQGNKLSSPFPDLGSLHNLNFLDASDNTISGELPANLPASLVQLTMRNNLLQGTIPESVQNLNYLQVIDLSNNKLSGSVPHILFSHPSLEQLTLANNQFTYIQIPASLGTQSNLIALDISQNQLQGLLPGFLPLIPRLSALSLEKNRFTGFIPLQYALKAVFPAPGISPLVRLLLGENYLFGPIPAPFLGMKAGSAVVSLAGNCLYRCPTSFFFCRGGGQKSASECKIFM